MCQKHCLLVFLAGWLLVKEYVTYVKFHTGSDKPEHDPLNNNNYIYIFRYIFRNIKTPNYVPFLLCVCLIYQSWMFVLLMMPHVGPMIRQYNIFYSIQSYNILFNSLESGANSGNCFRLVIKYSYTSGLWV